MSSPSASKRPSRILFGSCNSQAYPQLLWSRIRDRHASAFIWVGDAVYGDSKHFDYSAWKTVVKPATPQGLHDLYLKQRKHVNYSQYILDEHASNNSSMYIYGTFDDHDYGIDNGDVTFSIKKASAIEFVETFLQMPADSVMTQRARSGKGVYGVKVFDFSRAASEELLTDEEAQVDPDVNTTDGGIAYSTTHSVAVFVLDIRTHKTPYRQNNFEKYYDDMEGDFLGNEQWAWFQQALKNSKAAVHIVANGLQVHANKFPNPNVGESWSRFPTAQAKLYQSVLQESTSPTLFISGDVHLAELAQKTCTSSAAGQSRGLVEMTTSGLTHSWGVYFCSSPTNYCDWWYIPWATGEAMKIGHYINPWNELLVVDDERDGAKSGLQYSLELNFGEVEFDWDNRQLLARVHGLDETKPLLSVAWNFTDLASSSLSEANANWTCVNHRGTPNAIHLGIAQIVSVSILIFYLLLPMNLTLLILVLGLWYLRRRCRGGGAIKTKSA